MVRKTITASFGMGFSNAKPVSNTVKLDFINHTAWSEIYVGLHKIVYEILPKNKCEMTVADAAMCRLVIISSHQLMEIMLFDLLLKYKDRFLDNYITRERILDSTYYNAFVKQEWIKQITNYPMNLCVEPFLSTEKLRKKRNKTVHTTSEIATLEMARSALYTQVIGAKALCDHFNEIFPYQKTLDKFILEKEKLFSQINFPKE